MFTRVMETHPCSDSVDAALAASMVAGNSFTSAEEVLVTAHLLARIYLQQGQIKEIGCSNPTSCVEASLVYGWLNRGDTEHFSIPKHLRPCVMAGIATWPARSRTCECSQSYFSRKREVEGATRFCLEQELRLLQDREEVSYENQIATTGD